MDDSDDQYNDNFEEFIDGSQLATKSLTQSTENLCENLKMLVDNMIEDAVSNFHVRRKIARSLPDTSSIPIKRNRITIKIDAPKSVYFYPLITISDIVDEYWDEDFMQDIINS